MTILDIDLSLIGRKVKPVTCEVVRELEASDLALLSTERGIQPTRLQRLRDSHHSLARLVALGHKGHEISLMTGYTESRISILKSDPAFAELVEFYRQNDIQEVADLQVRLAHIALDAAQEIHERLQDSPEAIALGELQDLLKLTADRTGHGPKATNVNVNIDLSDRIRAARQRLVQASAPALAPEVSPPNVSPPLALSPPKGDPTDG